MQGASKRNPQFPGPESPHGQGGHHVCHNCGWSFPNPHPSAKQRRAHRKHCGKIEWFPLVSPHGDDNGGGNGNGEDDGAAVPVSPAAAHGGELSDVDPQQQEKPTSSFGAVGGPAMEEGNVETGCGLDEGLEKISRSIGFHGDETLVGILPGRTAASSEAASNGDEDLKVPDLPSKKEIQVNEVDALEQLANSEQSDTPTTFIYTSNMERDRIAAEVTDDGEGCTADFITSPLDSSVITTCAKVDQNVLNESLVETGPAAEGRSQEEDNLDLESYPVETTKNNDFTATEFKLLDHDNFVEVNVPSNLSSTCSEGTSTLGPDTDEVGQHELVSEPVNLHSYLMKVDSADHLGAYLSSGKVEKQNDKFDSDVKENEDNYSLSGSMSAELTKEDVFKNLLAFKNRGEAEPHIFPGPVVAKADLKPEDCTIDDGLPEVRSVNASIAPGKNSTGSLSSGWAHENNLEFEKSESDLSAENVQGTEGPASVEVIEFPFTVRDQPTGSLIRGFDGPNISSVHIEESIECCSGDDGSFPDLAEQLTSEVTTIKDGITDVAFNLLTQANEGKIDSHIAAAAGTERHWDDVDDARYCQESLKEMTDPESTSDISNGKSLHYQGVGESKVQIKQELPEPLAMPSEGILPCSPPDIGSESLGFIHLEAWIDHSTCADSIQKEVDGSQSITQAKVEPRSCIKEKNQQSYVDLGKNEHQEEPELIHVSPTSDTSKSIIDGTSGNLERMSSMSNLILHQKSGQDEVHESSAESAGDDGHDGVIGETHLQIKPSETHSFFSEKHDQEEQLSQHNEVQLGHQSAEIPTTDMVSLPAMPSGIDHAVSFDGEIALSICHLADKQADHDNDQDAARYHREAHKEMIFPECASDISDVNSLHSQDLRENKVQRGHESTESVAVTNEDSQPCPGVVMGSESHDFIHLEAWIDYNACSDSTKRELEGGWSLRQSEMECGSYVTEEKHHSHMDAGKNELGQVPELTCASPTDTARSVSDNAPSNLESMPSMFCLNLHQNNSQNKVHDSSMESVCDDEHDIAIREKHVPIRPSEAHNIFSEKPEEEEDKEESQDNEVQLSHQCVKIPTTDDEVSLPNMLSEIQGSISAEVPNRNGLVASSISYQVEDRSDHLILKEEDTAVFLAQDALMDTISQTDSIEGHWGSVADSLQGFDAEAPSGVKAGRSKGSLLFCKEQRTETADPSEAQTSVTLADGSLMSIEMEPLCGIKQSSSHTSSNGTSPSHTQVIRESQERKKKEEIIAKVESWSSGKQHTNLKTLLVEANHESKQKSPNSPLQNVPRRSNRSHVLIDAGLATGTVAPTSELLTESSAKKEAQKEWNSPARFPTKNDKKRVKGKQQWVPFLCCPSIN